jgi:DNA (cytosine-5)-methyltransferase 1
MDSKGASADADPALVASDQAASGFDPLRVLSLFAGIGGFDLGLERTGGFKTVAFCEIDKKARAVLRKCWPEVYAHDDIRTLTARQLIALGILPDGIAAGFPCQDISLAGAGLGLAGERSGLYYEIIRLLREFEEAGRPIKFVLLENVAALLGRGLGDVLGALAALGFHIWWDCIPASAVGAKHQRDRIWIVADLDGARLSKFVPEIVRQINGAARSNSFPVHPAWSDGDTAQAVLLRGVHGLPGRVDRVRQLGNAVVPQIPELIGRAILAARAA